MAPGKCPDCGAQQFYITDPDDRYTLREFRFEEEDIVYLSDEDDVQHLEVEDGIETYCDRCAWHDKFNTLK